MRILVIFPNNPYYSNSAAANRYAGLFDGLLEHGCLIDLLVTGGFKTKQERSCTEESRHPNLRFVYSLPFIVDGKTSILKDYFFYGLFDRLTISRIKKYVLADYDVLWLGYDSTDLFAFCKLRARIVGKTFIELNEFNDIGLLNTKNKIHYKRALRENNLLVETLRSIDSIAVMTKTLEKHYKEIAGEKCKFIHLPMTVDLSRFNKKSDNIDYLCPYIAFTGTMNNAKDGVDVLIKAFGKVANKYPNIHLYLAGFWHYDVPEQDNYIERVGLSSRVHRLGVLTRDEIPPLLCNARVLALSRPDSHQAQGGFPTKLGEYLATGNPVCVTKVGEIPDYLEDNVSAFMATPGDVDSFADALDRALCDDYNSQEVGRKGRLVAEASFSSELQANRLHEFFNQLTHN